MYLNQLTIIGFTGQDGDFHFSSNGTLVTTLSVATKESWNAAAGDWQSHYGMASHRDIRQARRVCEDFDQGNSRHGSGLAGFARVRKEWCLAPAFFNSVPRRSR